MLSFPSLCQVIEVTSFKMLRKKNVFCFILSNLLLLFHTVNHISTEILWNREHMDLSTEVRIYGQTFIKFWFCSQHLTKKTEKVPKNLKLSKGKNLAPKYPEFSLFSMSFIIGKNLKEFKFWLETHWMI